MELATITIDLPPQALVGLVVIVALLTLGALAYVIVPPRRHRDRPGDWW